MATGAKYYHSCINCGGINTDTRNEKGLPCEQCLSQEQISKNIFESLKKKGTLKDYQIYWNFQQNFDTFEKFFEHIFQKPLTGYQRTWARRFLLSKSFTLVAPTGVGKTTFGLVASFFLALNGKKSALVFPTISLAQQSFERLEEFKAKLENANAVKILLFNSMMTKSRKEEFEKRFLSCDFDILIITTQFVSKRKDVLSKMFFNLVFVDDVDAILKSSKNIDTLLQMIGFSEDEIEKATKRLRSKNKENGQDTVSNGSKNKGMLIVSSATAKPQGLKPLLFRELLGFEIGRFTFNIRNITNIRIKKKSIEKLLEIINILKDGILLFVNTEEEGREMVKFLLENGIKIGATWNDFEKEFELFKEGKLNVICGVSSYYGKLIRGIDLPSRIKYCIFWETPCFRFFIDMDKAPRFVLERVFAEYLDNHPKLKEYFKNVYSLQTEKLRQLVSKYISKEDYSKIVNEIFSHLKLTDDGKLVIPDVPTYIQGSGRTSRMFGMRLTKGVSILFEEDDTIFESLKSRLMFLLDEEWMEENEADFKSLMEEVEESRKIQNHDFYQNDTKSRLMIVESPTKADTISKFLEKASTRRYGKLSVYESITPEGILLITASKGHVYDLETKKGLHGVEYHDGKFIPYYNSIKRCMKCNTQFTDELDSCPKCASNTIDDKKEILKTLRELSLEVDEVLIATDPDVEGEKISWDISQYIKPANSNIKRIEMHEITRYGLDSALRNPRQFNTNLVKSQIVRRIEDRWVGFELSSKLQENFKSYNLSAGRVQSTILGWIVEREKEYAKSERTFTLLKLENGYNLEIEGEIECERVKAQIVEQKIEEISAPAPFSTSSLLSLASQKLNLGVPQIMEILQFLFEHGFITYHRTDSTRISVTGQNIARMFLEKVGKKELFLPRSFGDEGAHEAIRPVKPISPEELKELAYEKYAQGISQNHIKVYQLIFNRFMSSQMKNPKVLVQKVHFRINDIEIVKDIPVKVEEESWLEFLPMQIYPLFENKDYGITDKRSYKKHTIQLYTQASLIDEMKQKNIGRPSTYAKMVETLFKRGYVFEDSFRRIRSTSLGKKVYSYLSQKYGEYVNEQTTRELEKLMDIVEEGKRDYQEILSELFNDLKNLIEN